MKIRKSLKLEKSGWIKKTRKKSGNTYLRNEYKAAFTGGPGGGTGGPGDGTKVVRQADTNISYNRGAFMGTPPDVLTHREGVNTSRLKYVRRLREYKKLSEADLKREIDSNTLGADDKKAAKEALRQIIGARTNERSED